MQICYLSSDTIEPMAIHAADAEDLARDIKRFMKDHEGVEIISSELSGVIEEAQKSMSSLLARTADFDGMPGNIIAIEDMSGVVQIFDFHADDTQERMAKLLEGTPDMLDMFTPQTARLPSMEMMADILAMNGSLVFTVKPASIDEICEPVSGSPVREEEGAEP